MQKRIYFRADADVKIGYGHFVRSLALAEMLKECFDCIFVTKNPTIYQKKEILNVCKLIVLSDDKTMLDYFISILKIGDIVVLDNYFFDSDYQKQIKQKGCKLICFGINDRHYHADIVFCFYDKVISSFSKESYTDVLTGLEWAILRKPFRINRISKYVVQKSGEVVVNFGGSDQFFLTEKFVSLLLHIESIKMIHIIAGDLLADERLDRLYSMKKVEVHHNASAEDMVSLFTLVDFAILSTSTVLQEALACGAKVLGGYYIENQSGFYSYLVEMNYIVGLGNLLEIGDDEFNSIFLHSEFENTKTVLDLSQSHLRYQKLFNDL